MSRPRLSQLDLWAEHERTCLRLLRAALTALADGPAIVGEVDLNRELYRQIVRATGADAASGKSVLAPITPEARNPPDPSDPIRTVREHKVPDFSWGYTDHLADPDDSARFFVIECKRLTAPSRNWTYTEQYVTAGILRFITIEHGYGKSMPTGAMIGYLQGMSPAVALAAVNGHAATASVPPLNLISTPDPSVADLDHQLERTFPVTPFRLVHLWALVG